jgi:hypothetical protein
MLLTHVADRLQAYERDGLHYHLAASGVYEARKRIGNVFSAEFRPYIIAGLLSYDMGRQLGKAPYQIFAERLARKLALVEPLIAPFMQSSLATVDLATAQAPISQAYELLAARGTGALNTNSTSAFYVGASKVLHWLNPELFLIIDSFIARAFHTHPDPASRVRIIRAGAPCYSAALYLRCLAHAQREITAYGEAQLRRDGGGLPLMNIYGNVAFQYAREALGKAGSAFGPVFSSSKG